MNIVNHIENGNTTRAKNYSRSLDTPKRPVVSYLQHLKNCNPTVPNAPEGGVTVKKLIRRTTASAGITRAACSARVRASEAI